MAGRRRSTKRPAKKPKKQKTLTRKTSDGGYEVYVRPHWRRR